MLSFLQMDLLSGKKYSEFRVEKNSYKKLQHEYCTTTKIRQCRRDNPLY
jgi:hypothetical protein